MTRMLQDCLRALPALFLALWATGCGTTGGTAQRAGAERPALVDVLKKGDLVEVTFSGNPTPPEDKAERIKDDGTITLPLIGAVVAEGKKPGELQKYIHDQYVPRFYQRLTVTVRTENRVFFVDGEVKSPGQILYSGEMTVLGAIASAGGFTDFAAKGRVELIRATGEKLEINASRAAQNPAANVPVLPGDYIYVPRRSPFGGMSR